MRTTDGAAAPRRRATTLALAACLSLLLTSLFTVTATAASGAAGAATFSPDVAGSELARLLNGERTTHGLAALAIDSFLADKTRDGDVACPDGSGTMQGRAKDMAVSDYFSHSLRLCPSYGALDAMRDWGYRGARGEIIAMNGGIGFGPATYTYGCDVSGAGCDGGTTTAPATAAKAANQFITSQGHRNIVLSTSYDRFACGAWQTANGAFYACLFSFGPAGTQSNPTPTPTASPAPTPAPTATATPAPTATPGPTASPAPTASPSSGPVDDVTAPTMTSLSAPSLVTHATMTFTATFGASDDVGVAGYDIRTKLGASGSWSSPVTQSATVKSFGGLTAGTWFVDVRARDAAGNVSPWREVVVVVPADDRTWSFSVGNHRTTGAAYIQRTATSTKAAGARIKFHFTGSSFSLVGTAGRGYGKVRISLDGHVSIVDTGFFKGKRAASTHYRVLLFTRSLTRGDHTITITCLGTSGRPTVRLDAIGWRD